MPTHGCLVCHRCGYPCPLCGTCTCEWRAASHFSPSEVHFSNPVTYTTSETPEDVFQLDAEMSRVANTAFSRIAVLWKLSTEEMASILNASSPDETLVRISYILGIYKALNTLFIDPDQADAWIKKPNEEFAGKSALEYILEDGSNLARVRHYLDSVLTGPSF